ncbi:MAG: STY4526/YPO1902 family pathogenicity island replication protein [Gammaproteobacteria bacterium]|nr:STY4526/YPO1902 family pathogenicity island replication protein [Gammaproteobacteria bacterium]MDE0252773.1 STY4526/YPO1902 family pathogenicity island replication protein [Gammaproteobacteria bacterium]MDE0402219.1 STY4526/YPO1902 family pathogenicity island replication protein [Gammaproteobacteria bacterium]
MAKTKEAELTAAILLYMIRCIGEGDLLSLHQMNVGEKEIEQLKQIKVLDLHYIDMLKSHCLQVQLNQRIFANVFQYMLAQHRAEDAIQQLLAEDAPYSMLEFFFGLSNREYTQRRKSLKNMTATGRTKEPSEDETDQLFALWSRHDQRDASGRFVEPLEYIAVAKELNVSVRSIWLLTERWIERGVGIKRAKQRVKKSN